MTTERKRETKKRRPKGTGRIYTRPNSPTLWIQYSRHGKPYRESAKTTKRDEAKKLLESRLAEITTETFVGPKAEKVRVEDLADDFLRDYRINGKKSLDDVEARWRLHLKPFFGLLRAKDVTSNLIARYVDARQQEGAKNATINREMAALKRMYRIGHASTPPKVHRLPAFPHLKENNVRTGFLDDGQYHKLVDGADLWFRALVECGCTYGWRIEELRDIRIRQIDLLRRSIRLEPGTTKNDGGREVAMTDTVHALLSTCAIGKRPDDHVFTRPDGKPVRSFRGTWEVQCTQAGLGRLSCGNCSEPTSTTGKCKKCGYKDTKYVGLIFHDLRRTAARNLRSAGVPETVIMKIGGWLTPSVFKRYAIVNTEDIASAMRKLQNREHELRDKAQIRHTEPDLASPATVGIIQ